MQAAPSQAEILLREFKDKKAAAAGRSKVCAAWLGIQGSGFRVLGFRCWLRVGCVWQHQGTCQAIQHPA